MNPNKQTKGLAYIFHFYPKLLIHFLNLTVIKDAILESTGLTHIPNNYSKMEVKAELKSLKDSRADIVIRLSRKNRPFLVIIIEAKNISATTQIDNLTDQLDAYLSDKEFPELNIYPNKIGVTLTRQQYIHMKHPGITWDDIINLIASLKTDHKFLILSETDKIDLLPSKYLATRHVVKYQAHKLSDFLIQIAIMCISIPYLC
jgi:hypothetical protein